MMKRVLVLLALLSSSSVAMGSLVLADNFDNKGLVPGSLYDDANSAPDVGAFNWDDGAGGTNHHDLVWVQSDIAQSGNALRLTRVTDPENPRSPQVRLRDHTNPTNSILPGGMSILTVDYRVEDTNTDGILNLQMNGYSTGDGPGVWLRNASFTINARDYGTGWVSTDYRVGTGGWASVEIVVNWDEEDAEGKVNGLYDVYLSRDASNSQGELQRTLIASNLNIRADTFTATVDHRIQLSNQPGHGTGADTVTYWDNINLTVIPEPGTMAILAAGLLLLLRFRHRDHRL